MDPDLDDITRHVRGLARLAGDILRDSHGGEDVAQEAVLRALVARRRPASAAEALPWLRTIAKRLAFNEQGARDARADRERSRGAPDLALPTAEVAARAETAERLHAAVRALPPDLEAVLLDRYVGGFTPSEIARRDQITARSVKHRLSRAKSELRRRLERDGIGGDDRWQLSLAPLAGLALDRPARRATSSGAAAAVTASTATGVSLMAKPLAAAAALLLAALGVLASGVLDGPGAPAREGDERGRDSLAGLDAAGGDAAPDLASAGVEASRSAVPPPAANSEAAPPTVRVRVTGAPDAAPVADFAVELRCEGEGVGREVVLRGRTDASGIVEFTGAPPGPAVILGASTGDVSVEIAARDNAFDLYLDSRLHVRGRVVDERGAPVAGAEVRVRSYTPHGGRRPVGAITGADGRFEVRHTEGASWLTVEADGFAPHMTEELISHRMAVGEPMKVVLRSAAGSVVALARTDDGSPVPGATVTLFAGHMDRWYGLVPDERTDADGVARFHGLAAGPYVLRIEHPRFAGTELETEIAPTGGEARVSAVLLEGVTVRGRVSCTNGALPDGLDVYLGGTTVHAIPDAEGEFELRHIAPGRVRVTVSAPNAGPDARLDTDAADGEVITWNPELRLDDAVVSGTILHDKPFDPDEWTVRARFHYPRWTSRRARPEADGRFTLSCPADVTFGEVTLERRGAYTYADALEDVRAGRSDLVLDARRAQFTEGVIRGRLTGPGAERARLLVAEIVHVDGSARSSPALYSNTWTRLDDSQSFELSGLTTGTYRLWWLGERSRSDFAEVEVAPDRPVVDVGEVHLPSPGGLRVEITPPHGQAVAEDVLVVLTNRFGSQVFGDRVGDFESGRGPEIPGLEPGTYQLRVMTDRTSDHVQDVTVPAGETVVISVQLLRRQTASEERR